MANRIFWPITLIALITLTGCGSEECFNYASGTTIGPDCKVVDGQVQICDAPRGEFGTSYRPGSCPSGMECSEGAGQCQEPWNPGGDGCENCGGVFCSGSCTMCSVCR